MYKQKIVIVDYGIGNTQSVNNALQYLGYHKLKITDNAAFIEEADLLILPGVGAFDEGIGNLKSRRLDDLLSEEVLVKKKPVLGICLGMQLFATYSEENGRHDGLNWIEGAVVKLSLPPGYSVPHVGWNNVVVKSTSPLYNRVENNSNYYFDHSYHFQCDDKYISGYCDYGITITASVQKDNIFGVQFHPEKSQTNGLKLFRSLINAIS
jgi:glutamine amidotransferase